MKNSHRSDRELAKALKVSQPTVTRTRIKLEKEGIIKEYTIIPDFEKIGFRIASIDFARLQRPFPEEKLMEIREQIRQESKKKPLPTIVGMSGMGCNADRVVVAFHEDYSKYMEYLGTLKQHPLVVVNQISSFVIDLTDKSQYLPLTLSSLADYIAHRTLQQSKKNPKGSSS